MPCSLAGHGGGVTANRCCAAAPVVQLSARCLHPSRKAKLPALRRRSRVLALAAQAVLCFVHHKRPRSQYGAAAPRFDAASQFLQSWVLADTVGLRSRLAPNCVMLGAPLFAADSPNGHSPTVIQGVDAAIQQRLFRCAVPSQVVLAIHDASVPPDEPGALYVYYSALSPHNVVHDWFQGALRASGVAFSDPSSFGLIKFVMDEGQRIGEVAVLRPARYQEAVHTATCLDEYNLRSPTPPCTDAILGLMERM